MEKSSGNRRRLGHITKPGNGIEAAQVTMRSLPEWRRKYVHLTMRRGRNIAKVAMARRLVIRPYWMIREKREPGGQGLFRGTALGDLHSDNSRENLPDIAPRAQREPAGLVEEALASSVLIFGKRPDSLSGRKARGKATVPEQAITDEENRLVAKAASTCMALRGQKAEGR